METRKSKESLGADAALDDVDAHEERDRQRERYASLLKGAQAALDTAMETLQAAALQHALVIANEHAVSLIRVGQGTMAEAYQLWTVAQHLSREEGNSSGEPEPARLWLERLMEQVGETNRQLERYTSPAMLEKPFRTLDLTVKHILHQRRLDAERKGG